MKSNDEPLISDREIMEFQSIVEESYTAITTLTEETFTRVFLPVLARHFVGVNDENFDITTWVNVARGIHRPVTIVDAEGKFLYEVPAVYAKPSLHNEHSTRSIFDMVGELKRSYHNYPHGAEQRVAEELTRNVAMVPKNIDERVAAWEHILSRHGYPIPWLTEDKVETTESATNPDSGMIESFEEV